MRIPRIYSHSENPFSFCGVDHVFLDKDASRHIGLVLRRNIGDPVIVFNRTDPDDYLCQIIEKNAERIKLKVLSVRKPLPKPRLFIHLMQAMCRPENMDWLIQKATELGVSALTPLTTTYAQRFRTEKKNRWNKIMISSCEQCGRHDMPVIYPSQSLSEALKNREVFLKKENAHGFFLTPDAKHTMGYFLSEPLKLNVNLNEKIYLFIGPEGGFSADEIKMAQEKGLSMVSLGPRILRAETAGIAALSALQAWVGDFI